MERRQIWVSLTGWNLQLQSITHYLRPRHLSPQLDIIAVADDAAAATATAEIVYSKGTGNLFYNSGIAAGVQFAQLSTGLTLSQNDFLVSAATVVQITRQ